MSMTSQQLEQQLRAAVSQQLQHYRQALHLAGSLSNAMQSGEAIDAIIESMNEQLRLSSELEVRHRQIKSDWQAAGGSPGSSLQTLLKTAQDTLEQLLPVIEAAEKHVRSRRDALTPKFEWQARSVQMRNAYASAAELSGKPNTDD